MEATSGNTGIAVAMMCAQRGYPCVITSEYGSCIDITTFWYIPYTKKQLTHNIMRFSNITKVAEPFSIERRKIMRMLGAKVIITPKAGKGTGMVEKAAELAEKNGW